MNEERKCGWFRTHRWGCIHHGLAHRWKCERCGLEDVEQFCPGREHRGTETP